MKPKMTINLSGFLWRASARNLPKSRTSLLSSQKSGSATASWNKNLEIPWPSNPRRLKLGLGHSLQNETRLRQSGLAYFHSCHLAEKTMVSIPLENRFPSLEKSNYASETHSFLETTTPCLAALPLWVSLSFRLKGRKKPPVYYLKNRKKEKFSFAGNCRKDCHGNGGHDCIGMAEEKAVKSAGFTSRTNHSGRNLDLACEVIFIFEITQPFLIAGPLCINR